jgi:thymidylate kinase
LIIIEGPDCSGKTTLAKHIQGWYNVPFYHLGLPPVGTRHWDIVRNALLNNSLSSVYDRMIIGSNVFGEVKPDAHNKNSVTIDEMTRWLKTVQKLGATLVLAMADDDVLLARFRERGDEYLNEEELLHSAQVYRNIFYSIIHDHGMQKNVVRYNSATQPVEYFIRENEERLWRACQKDRQLDTNEKKFVIESMS